MGGGGASPKDPKKSSASWLAWRSMAGLHILAIFVAFTRPPAIHKALGGLGLLVYSDAAVPGSLILASSGATEATRRTPITL